MEDDGEDGDPKSQALSDSEFEIFLRHKKLNQAFTTALFAKLNGNLVRSIVLSKKQTQGRFLAATGDYYFYRYFRNA
jgi:hypothetical protein